MADRDRAPAGAVSDEARAAKFVQPADATTVSDGDASTTPEAMAYLTTYGVDAWIARYGLAANSGGTVS